MKNVLILVPQQIELDPLLRALSASGFEARTGAVGRLKAALFEDLGLWLSVAGHGKTELALRGQHLLDNLPAVSAVVCAGAAGSLRPEVRRGDVVVANHRYAFQTELIEKPFEKLNGMRKDVYPAVIEGVREAVSGAVNGVNKEFPA